MLGRDYTIGHAYLMNMNYDKDLDVEVVREYIWKEFHPAIVTGISARYR